VRDVAGLREYDLAAYCTGEATRGIATAVIPTDDVVRAIESAQQVQRENGASASIANERWGAAGEAGSGGCDDTGRKKR
jgi:hypothetical protein